MKRKPIEKLPLKLPPAIEQFIEGARIFDSSCSPEARVYFIDKDSGYFLKSAACGTLAKEAMMTEYFHSKKIGTEVLQYHQGDSDLLLTARVRGEDCTHPSYLSDPKRLTDTLAEKLRELHETDYTGCPVMNRNQDYFKLAENNFRAKSYDLTLFGDVFSFRSAEEAYTLMQEGKPAFICDTLLHGDYCLPNIILDGWRLSAFIDLGNGGVGERHIDIFWGVWTLWFNLHTNKYYDRFLDAYGRDRVDEEKLRIVAAAEIFG